MSLDSIASGFSEELNKLAAGRLGGAIDKMFGKKKPLPNMVRKGVRNAAAKLLKMRRSAPDRFSNTAARLGRDNLAATAKFVNRNLKNKSS